VNSSSSSRDVAAPSFLVSALATLALALVTALAFSTANTATFRHVRATSADGATLLFLALCAALIGWTPLQKYFLDTDRFDRSRHNAATFALAAAMFVIYSLARRSGPEGGWSLRFAFLPDDGFVVPFAAHM
jgi:drug/metabolite transporter (DMT)-like permease